MPNEHGSPTPVRLLIAESSERHAARFESILRDAGIATRAQLIDLPMAGDALAGADVMLCNAELPQLDRLLPQLRSKAPTVPIILVDHREQAMKTAQGLRLGAADVVCGADSEELLLVFRRELENVYRARRLEQLDHSLKEAERRCELLLQSSEAAIAYIHEGMHIHANAPYLKLFGFSEVDEVLGLPLIDLLAEDSAQVLKAEIKRFRQHGGEDHLSFDARSTDGRAVTGTMTLSAAQWEGEHCIQIMVRTAAPALRQAHAGPDSDAASPAASECGAASLAPAPCTATDSREAWSGVGEFLDKATRVFADPAPCMAVLVVQIAGFDQLQVEHGLRNGELISNCVRDTLETQLRGCAVTRLASHQFAAAVRQPDRDHLRSFCAALLEPLTALSIPLGHGRTGVQLGIGAALLETEGTTPAPTRVESALDLGLATAVRLADAASSRFELVGGSLDAEVPESESGRVLTQVNRAIETNAFRLLFQPIISLRDDASEHYEAFLRMVDESGEEVRPDAFLDTAIANGVAGKIDRWVILNAIKALLGHRAQGNGTRMTISITANSIADPDFGAWLGVALKAARLPSDAIIFQISERDIRSMARQAQSFVQSLRELHCQTTLARFGGSDDAFEQLKHLAVDYVKLDGTLIEKLGADPAARAQVAQTLHRLQQLGKLSIVPKVETAAMLSALWQGGANFVQGNYLQPPRPEMDFEFQHFSA